MNVWALNAVKQRYGDCGKPPALCSRVRCCGNFAFFQKNTPASWSVCFHSVFGDRSHKNKGRETSVFLIQQMRFVTNGAISVDLLGLLLLVLFFRFPLGDDVLPTPIPCDGKGNCQTADPLIWSWCHQSLRLPWLCSLYVSESGYILRGSLVSISVLPLRSLSSGPRFH